MNRFRSPLSFASVTQYLVLVNVVIYAVQLLLQPHIGNSSDIFSLLDLRYNTWFELTYGLFTPPLFPNAVWQVFTYMFLHGSIFHIFFNMYVLYQFGHALERVWGPKYYISYYLFTGVGAGITVILLSLLTNHLSITIGASGAIFGLLLAYGMLFPNQMLYLFFAIPMPAKYAVIVFGGIEFVLMVSNLQPGVSHIGHLGGLLFGFIFLKGRSLIRRL
jgi:membrane associated rhomboid family serine protease